jgi:hypothetical protein
MTNRVNGARLWRGRERPAYVPPQRRDYGVGGIEIARVDGNAARVAGARSPRRPSDQRKAAMGSGE